MLSLTSIFKFLNNISASTSIGFASEILCGAVLINAPCSFPPVAAAQSLGIVIIILSLAPLSNLNSILNPCIPLP
jgi:hypothetical protein